MTIKYVKGDATLHKQGVITHIVNDIGGWGRGFVLPLAERYPKAKQEYLDWAANIHCYNGKTRIPFVLGQCQFVNVAKNLYVCNLVGQRDIVYFKDIPPVRYQSILEGLYRLKDFCVSNKITSIGMPRIACGLAGGKWELVEKILKKVFDSSLICVTIYDIDDNEWPGTTYE